MLRKKQTLSYLGKKRGAHVFGVKGRKLKTVKFSLDGLNIEIRKIMDVGLKPRYVIFIEYKNKYLTKKGKKK